MSDQTKSRAARRQQMEAEKRRGKNKKNKSGGIPIKKIFLSIVALGIAVLIGGVGLFAFYASTAPDLDESFIERSTYIQYCRPQRKCLHEIRSRKTGVRPIR